MKTGSPGSEVVTLQQFLEESNKLTSIQVSFVYGDFSLGEYHHLELFLFLNYECQHTSNFILYSSIYRESLNMTIFKPGMVMHFCNPVTWWGRRQEDQSSRPARANLI
jgi:hypothetical protein